MTPGAVLVGSSILLTLQRQPYQFRRQRTIYFRFLLSGMGPAQFSRESRKVHNQHHPSLSLRATSAGWVTSSWLRPLPGEWSICIEITAILIYHGGGLSCLGLNLSMYGPFR